MTQDRDVDQKKPKAWVMRKDRVTRAKIRDDIRLQKVYSTAKTELLRYSYLEFRRLFRLAGVLHDVAGVADALPLMRKMLSVELHGELLSASQVYFEDLKKAHYSIDGHGRKLDPAKYLALNSKAKGWISVGRDVDGDIVERYLSQCEKNETGWSNRRERIRRERVAALLTIAPSPIAIEDEETEPHVDAPGP